VFICYALAGRSRGRVERLSWPERQQLQAALTRAQEEGDHTAVQLIEEFIGISSFDFEDMPPMSGLFQEILDELTENLNSDDPNAGIDRLEELLQQMGVPLPGEPKRKR